MYKPLCNIDDKILYICDKEYGYFFNKPNVVAVGLGYKIKNGFCTYRKCIKVCVSKKIDNDNLNINSLIPIIYKGIETDVVQTGSFEAKGLTKKVRPVLGGYSIGPAPNDITGTMSCLVRDNSNHNLYVLGSSHILANENRLPKGTQIIQPGKYDGGRAPRDTIAILYNYIPIFFSTATYFPVNFVDCGIAKVNNPNLVSSKLYCLNNITGIVAPHLDQSVRKVGRSTGITYGYVTSLGTVVKTNFDIGPAYFKNQIITTSMCASGDSGGLLLDLNNKVIGMLNSGSTGSVSSYSPISKVLSTLNVSIVT
ncbi:trypsin-like peptidase domain-containing protein [Clostridium botulinum]|nr:trypsin-like peptidase domain-containing protein [Clostridium botulinum]NFL04199.1 trypsin-like peptidase domain-containing protein [Clostridium botulinum]